MRWWEVDTLNILKNRLDKYWTNQELIYDFNACLIGTGDLPVPICIWMFDREDAGIEEYLQPSELIGLDWMWFSPLPSGAESIWHYFRFITNFINHLYPIFCGYQTEFAYSKCGLTNALYIHNISVIRTRPYVRAPLWPIDFFVVYECTTSTEFIAKSFILWSSVTLELYILWFLW